MASETKQATSDKKASIERLRDELFEKALREIGRIVGDAVREGLDRMDGGEGEEPSPKEPCLNEKA